MDNIFFIDHLFISTHPLTPENILDYFSTSPFYDKSSNNEIFKMQNQFRGISTIKEEVLKHKGMFYTLDYNTPDNNLFIIRQGYNDKESKNLNFYYVINGFIYKAPTNHKIYNSRVNNIYWYLNEILDFYFHNIFGKNIIESRFEEHENIDVLRDVMSRFEKLQK